jgi:hypothetical protein
MPGERLTGTSPADADASAGASRRRGRFPIEETLISLGFITVLTIVTLLMMRRSARLAARPADVERLMHENDHLRARIRQLESEMEQTKENREA